MTRPPKLFLTGSHSLCQRNESPYSLIAGIAPIVSETRMPASRASVSQAAPCASAENSTSAHGEARRDTGGGSFDVGTGRLVAADIRALRDRSLPRIHVVEEPRATVASARPTIPTCQAIALPDASLMFAAHDLRTSFFTDVRQRDILEVVGHLVAVGVGPVEEPQRLRRARRLLLRLVHQDECRAGDRPGVLARPGR